MDTSAPGDANPGSSQVAQGGTYDKNGGTENDNDKGEHGGSKEEDEDRPDQAKPEAHSALQSHCEGPGNARTDGARPNAKPRQLLQGRTMKDVAHARASDIKEQMSTRKEKLKSKAKPPGGLDDTPLPDAPPGYTVKFTFLKCTNLPPSDLHTTAADPYLVATLTTNLPRRHREDPPLEHRTRTIYRQTEPEWNEEWIVANVPGSGFTLKCRLYDEDWPDRNDRLGNVTVHVPSLDENWGGWPPPKGKEFPVKKRVGSKTAYLVKGIASALSTSIHMTPHMYIAAEVLGRSDPPHGQMFTLGPSRWVQHFSPVFGRLTGTKVNKDSSKDAECSQNHEEKKTQKHE